MKNDTTQKNPYENSGAKGEDSGVGSGAKGEDSGVGSGAKGEDSVEKH
jgi:hypothetical protein